MIGIYSRISQLKEEGKDRSINDQKLLGEEKANELQIPFKHYSDVGISGAGDSLDERPGLSNLLEDIISGDITKVFVIDESRLSRNPRTKYLITDIFKDYNVITHSYIDGILDYSNPDTEFISEIKGIIHKRQVTETKIKIKSALKRNARDGKVNGAIVPYGYRKDDKGYMVIDDEEAKVIRLIFKMSLEGTGTTSIAYYLNNEGIKTRYGKDGKGTLKTKNKLTGKKTTTFKKDTVWSQNTVLQIIKNSLYKGERKYKGEILEAPAIISKKEWNKTNDHLQENKLNGSGPKVNHQFLVRGILKCGVCGQNMYGKKTIKNNYYECASKRLKTNHKCNNKGINITFIENFIWDKLFEDELYLNWINKHFTETNPEVKIEELNQEKKIIQKELTNNIKEKDRVIQLIVKGIINETEGDKEIIRIRKENNIIEIKLSNIETQIKSYIDKNLTKDEISQHLQNIPKEISFNDKKVILEKYIHSITSTYLENIKYYKLEINFEGRYITRFYVDKGYKAITWVDDKEDDEVFEKYGVNSIELDKHLSANPDAVFVIENMKMFDMYGNRD
ncbi:MAG: recombinase family protein [Aequorivita sp.]|nr:recombinase family protein [Aequorivita sp.]